ncbi:transcription factor SPT20 homolog isoform X1 [Apis dorsata]|uniref:transcription factor SPT20 homolog isoform X1 n=1 Tax=Apis dorsata TaxID=7462 RepID=UPI0003DF6094|nr:transcription factor SPT20 homolog isoform X1 [Apis dorsata]XP_006613810.1 transcription factor SPT20 homolog isoform X1 [Apis dorsata]XP_031365400.1 transcription factor SPT20 homolog isoform X1 [Apis dorsata]
MIGTASSLEDACRQAQDMINQVSKCWKNIQGQNSVNLICDKSSIQKKDQSHSKHSIQSKLTRLYFEELTKVPYATPDSVLNNLENECDLLGRLVQREGLHTLIVNLYAGNKGYSLAIRNSDKGNQYDKNSILAETQLMGYEQGELLSCIDNGQLPAMLAEQLETNHSHLFYDGCIIAEVRDYRKTFPHTKAEVHHVLLKPTTQSVLSDVSTLTSDGDWSHEERLMLESHLVAATQGPLCLDPNPIPSLATTRLKQSKSLLTDHQLMRQAKKFSQVTVNRKRKLEQLAQPEGLTIQDLMQKLRAKRGIVTATACPTPSLTNPPLLPPNTPIDVLRFAKAYERPRETKDCLPHVIEEYILETGGNQGEIDHIKLSILQRPSNSEYLGELYMDKNHREGEKNGSACRFTLGTRVLANHYIQQFTEIFTEEGRKNVRIKHVVPGQVPRVTCTPGMQRAHQQAQQAKAAQLVAQHLQQAQSQHVAQQILSRAQGQLNTLAGQVASMKTMTETTTSAQNNLTCVDATSIPQVIAQNEATSISPGQTLTNGGSNASTSVQIDNSTMSVTDGSSCNGSGILVFQQKSNNTINNATSTNVPVLQAQLQAGTQNCVTETVNQNQSEIPFKKHSTNPAITALVTSLMNSAQQFQQQAAANAAAAAMNTNAQTTNKSNNAAILSLLNSSPANLTQQKVQPRRISLNASIPSRVLSHGNVINVPSTTGQVRVSLSSTLTGQLSCKQQPVKATAVKLARVQDPTSTLGLSMSGLSALLAGTPSADNPIPGINSGSSLLERLTASSSQNNQSATSMTTPPSTNVNLQGVNLTSLSNSINGLQNVQVSFPGLSQPITMSLNVSATTGSVTPTGVIVSLPISSATNTCTTVSSMVATTVVTTAIAGSTPTVVIANPANTHLSLPIAQIIPSAVKGLSQQNIRSNNSVTLAQGGQAIQLVGSQRPRLNHITRQVQPNQVKSTVLSNQLVTVAKTVTASQLILSGNKQVLTPIMAATKPVLMASQTTPSSQVVPANKQTLLTKSLHARASTGQCSQQTQNLGVTTLSQQQLQRTLVKPVQLQQLQCLTTQHKVAVATSNSQNRTQIEPQRNSTSAPGEDPA